jgi:hypothetical protein
MKAVATTPSTRRTYLRQLSMWMLRASLFAIILAVVSLPPAMYAQEVGETVTLNVPFAFEVGSQRFPPGFYTIQMKDQHIILIRGSLASGYLGTWFDEDEQPSKTSKVIFRKYGDRYFIGEIWTAGDGTHTYTVPSKAEKKLDSELAENKTSPTGVEVAVLSASR